MENLIFLYWPSQFQELTLHYALENVAKQLGLNYIEIRYGPNACGFPLNGKYSNSLVFFIFDPHRTIAHINEMREKCPNSRLIQFSGDTIYYGPDEKVFDNIDVHIDCMYTATWQLKEFKLPVHHFYWSISEKFIKTIEQHNEDFPKSLDLICLCTDYTDYRHKLFDDLKSKYSIAYNLKESNVHKIISKYKEAKIVLGTSSPCAPHYNARSCKGFRDWIAPFTNSVLIYDDIEEMKPLKKIVPLYRYNDKDDMFRVIDSLKNDEDKRKFYIDKQRVWALQNSCDKQFLRILQKYENQSCNK